MATKGPEKFVPSPNNIRVNDIKELRGKLDYDNLPPVDKLAIDSAVREWIAYCLTLPQFAQYRKLRRRRLHRGGTKKPSTKK